MKYAVHILVFCIIFLVVGCGSQPKADVNPEKLEALGKVLENKSFTIQADWARPLPTQSMNAIANAGLIPLGSTLNRIDLAGTESYLRIEGDSAKARLAYYGEQQMPGVYNPEDAGISFNGVPDDFTIVQNPKKGGYNMSFEIDNDTENFEVTAWILPSKTATISIVSTHRRLIQYGGELNAIKED